MDHRRLPGAVLDGLRRALPDLLGADLTVVDAGRPIPAPRGVPTGTTVAAWGVGKALAAIQHTDGPTPTAARSGRPVRCPDLWHDARWPTLTPDRAARLFPRHASAVRDVRGVVAVPGLPGSAVLTGYLDHRPTDYAEHVLLRHERLAAAVVALAGAPGVDRAVAVLRRHDVVERAKGIVMARCGVDDTTAWRLLCESGADPVAVAAELVARARPARRSPEPGVERAARALWNGPGA